jgi:hypothetical protein
LIDDGNMLEVSIRVEDPDTYYEPWSAIQCFRRVQQQMREEVCAENNRHLFDYGTRRLTSWFFERSGCGGEALRWRIRRCIVGA